MSPRSALVIVASDRAFRGTYEDISGEILLQGLKEALYANVEKIVIPDEGGQIAAAISNGIERNIDLIITSGGTGISARDITPDVTAPLIERLLPGIAEALRAQSRERVPNSDLSRGVAGVSKKSLIVNLPGSPGAAKDGLVVILRIAEHVHAQLNDPVNSHG